MPCVVVIDNYDSFVYNLVQYLGELGADPIVYRPDENSVEGIEELPMPPRHCQEDMDLVAPTFE